MRCCSSTHDCFSYVLSELSNAIKNGKLHQDFHIVLDEAYPCTNQELSPYRGRNLPPYEDSFNFHLSQHRQVIERAFGLLTQRFGIFWRPLRVQFSLIPSVIRVCVKLHNICVERFGLSRPEVNIERDALIDDEIFAVHYTDLTGNYQGRRADLLDDTRRRKEKTEQLRTLNRLRPPIVLIPNRIRRIRNLN
jgi:hypothetical protein